MAVKSSNFPLLVCLINASSTIALAISTILLFVLINAAPIASALTTPTAIIPSLTPSVTWSLRMDFAPSQLRTRENRISPISTRQFDVIFKPLDGYEPPQGTINGDGITGSYLLSEDPEDRKDGLWVWGLFKDPLYPFCLVKVRGARASNAIASDANSHPLSQPPLRFASLIAALLIAARDPRVSPPRRS